jgi:predicted Zn finger-like uncharacterized protein
MILTCPECATSYNLDDAKLGPMGRTVQCAACKTRWHAVPTADELKLDLATSISDKNRVLDVSQVEAKALPKLYRTLVQDKKRNKAMAQQGLIWGCLAASCAAVLGLGYVLRVDIVKTFPSTAKAYAILGTPVNAAGLEFKNTYTAVPAFKGGRFVVEVKADIINIRDEPTPVPPIFASLKDQNLKEIGSALIPSNGLMIDSRAVRTLRFDIADPSNLASKVDLKFDLAAKKGQKDPKAHLNADKPNADKPSAAKLRSATTGSMSDMYAAIAPSSYVAEALALEPANSGQQSRASLRPAAGAH